MSIILYYVASILYTYNIGYNINVIIAFENTVRNIGVQFKTYFLLPSIYLI